MSLSRRFATMVGIAALVTGLSCTSAVAETTGNGESFAAGNCNFYERPQGGSYDATTGEPLTEAWQITRLAPEPAWEIATGKGVTAAVIDTGVDNIDMDYYTHERVKAFNFAGYTETPQDGSGYDCTHGTKVVSLLASRRSTSSDASFSGMAPDVTVRAYRALQLSEAKADSLEPFEPTVKAVRQAIKDKVDLINISQSAPTDNPAYREAIKDALAAGIVVVAAAGNAGASGPSYPAAYPGVIAVAMTTRTDAVSENSQWGTGMDISVSAPGENLLSLLPSRRNPGLSYDTQSVTGTSFAAPLVSGVVAMILQKYPHLTPAQVKQRLELSADPPAGGVPDARMGYGIVNPSRALTMVISDEATESVAPARVEPPLPVDQRPTPDQTVRNVSIAVAGLAIAGTAVGVTLRFTYPAARKRKFAPAHREQHDRDSS